MDWVVPVLTVCDGLCVCVFALSVFGCECAVGCVRGPTLFGAVVACVVGVGLV